HATLARRTLLRLDSMAAPDPHSLGVPRPQFPRLCPACLPRYSLQTILRRVLETSGPTGRVRSPSRLGTTPASSARRLSVLASHVGQHAFSLGIAWETRPWPHRPVSSWQAVAFSAGGDGGRRPPELPA